MLQLSSTGHQKMLNSLLKPGLKLLLRNAFKPFPKALSTVLKLMYKPVKAYIPNRRFSL